MTTAISRPLESSYDDSTSDPTANAEAGRAPVVDGSDTSGGRAHGFGVLKSLGQLLGSQALISLTGLVALPLLFRNLGAADYGLFSLFLLALGLLSSLDIARPTMVLELSGAGDAARARELQPLIGVSQLLLGPLAFGLGALVFEPWAGVALGLAVVLFVSASGPYAVLASQGRVGVAASTRNFAWVGAFLAATGMSFHDLPAQAYFWPFAVANFIVLLVNRHLAGAENCPWFARPSAALLQRFRGRSFDILGLSLATAVVISADKLILQTSSNDEVFGHYAAQYDLAIKINVLSSALGTVLFPAFSRLFAEQGRHLATEKFVRQTSWIVGGYFVGLLVLLLFSEEVLSLVLGAESDAGVAVYPLFLFGIFLALFGHLITPWQRACGDFRTHRRIYAATAVIMIAVGVFAIPAWGALGAALTFLSARVADVLLIASEVRRTPRQVLGRPRLAALAAMTISLAVIAGLQFVELGGLA